jgi:hypothetical protein
MKNIPLIILFFFCSNGYLIAQKKFIEGDITYSLKIAQNQMDDGQQNVKGIFKIKIKGEKLLKEMILENGFNNTILYNGINNSYFSFRKVGNQSFAIQLNKDHFEKQRANCAQMNIEPLMGDIKTIKNFRTEKAKLLCNNQKPIIVQYTKDWSLNNTHLFDEFPQFQFLPLAFEIVKNDGSIFSFELINIEEKLMDNGEFEIPNGYKIITQEEFKSWQH